MHTYIPTMNKTQITVNQQQTNNIRHAIVTDNTNGLKRQRMQAADINKRPKKQGKTDSTDPEFPMNKTLRQYFSTDPGASTSKKRGAHPMESSQRLKRRNIQITDH